MLLSPLRPEFPFSKLLKTLICIKEHVSRLIPLTWCLLCLFLEAKVQYPFCVFFLKFCLNMYTLSPTRITHLGILIIFLINYIWARWSLNNFSSDIKAEVKLYGRIGYGTPDIPKNCSQIVVFLCDKKGTIAKYMARE